MVCLMSKVAVVAVALNKPPLPRRLIYSSMKNYHDRIAEIIELEKSNVRTYERNAIVQNWIIASLDRVKKELFIIFPEPDNSPNYVKRRRLLKHESNCPMGDNVALDCICHYDDCLNSKTVFLEKCICKRITHENYAKALFEYSQLPFWRRLFTARPRFFKFTL